MNSYENSEKFSNSEKCLNTEKFSNSQLNEDFWAEYDSISESGDVSQAYNELDEESSPNKSLESK
jgi:hypothetical protein